MTEGRKASFRPSDFVDDTVEQKLLYLSCEEAISDLASEELERSERNVKDAQCTVRVPLRAPPLVIQAAFHALAWNTGRSQSLVSKCLTRHGLAILRTIPGVEDTANLRNAIVELSGEHQGLSDIVGSLEDEVFTFASPARSGRMEFKAANWAVGNIGEICVGLSLSEGESVAIANVLSLTTTNLVKMAGVARDLMPEVMGFLRYVQERLFSLEALYQRALLRVGGKGGTCNWRHVVGICWQPEGEYHTK